MLLLQSMGGPSHEDKMTRACPNLIVQILLSHVEAVFIHILTEMVFFFFAPNENVSPFPFFDVMSFLGFDVAVVKLFSSSSCFY